MLFVTHAIFFLCDADLITICAVVNVVCQCAVCQVYLNNILNSITLILIYHPNRVLLT